MNYPKKRIAIAIAMIGCAAQPLIVHAEESTSQLERVEVVGSNIKRAATKQATQVEVYKTEEFTKQGITTTQDIVNALASNQSNVGSSQGVGAETGGASYANLRGLGSQYTLVLVDGRRAANTPISGFGSAVDLNSIPLAAIDRIEILKDGASAIYGTDAIGGVINFVTKKSLQGITVSVDYASPVHSGGGTEKKASVAGGIGNLNKDGWNVQGSLDVSRESALMAKDRNAIAVDRNPSLSLNSYPANYFGTNGTAYNGAYPNCRAGTVASGFACRENTNNWIGISPKVERTDVSAKATKKLGADHEVSLQYLRSETKTTMTVAPTPMSGALTISPGNPYYPATNPDGNLNQQTDANGNPIPLALYGRTVEAGPRVNEATITSQRVQSNLEGIVAGWDYKTGIGYAESVAKDALKSGYVSSTLLQNAIDQGKINPFGTNSADAWNSVALSGDLYKSTMQLTTADFKVSKEILELPAGNLAVAFGVEARHEKLKSDINSLAGQAMSSGLEGSKSAKGNRSVHALYSEILIPVTKELEADIAARYDSYNDFGTTFNPKITLKYTPTKQLMFRGSGSTGFRAPTLFNMYQPNQKTFTADQYPDPSSCADGKNPTPGHAASCTPTQLTIMQGGNSQLRPETSTSTSLGMVVEPISSVTLSADMWWTTIKHQVGVLPESTIMGNPIKYAHLIVKKADGTTDYIIDTDQNLGNVRASGIDLFGMWRLPRTSFGNFNVSVNSTYMTKYDYQEEEGGEYKHNVGRYAGTGPIFRWKTELTLGWNLGSWSSTISQSYVSGYEDQKANSDGSAHMVQGSALWNASVSYDWKKVLNATLGLRNVFDQKPQYTNQTQNFQTGYDPRYSDIYGRTVFFNLTYKM